MDELCAPPTLGAFSWTANGAANNRENAATWLFVKILFVNQPDRSLRVRSTVRVGYVSLPYVQRTM